MYKHWCMLLILYAVNAAACKRCHLEALCPWERYWQSSQSSLHEYKHPITVDYSRGPVFRYTFVVHVRNISTNIRICEIWDFSSLLGTFRLQGVMSINETKGLCVVKLLTKWQRSLLHTLKDVATSNLKHCMEITALHRFLNHQRVTNGTRQCSSLCCTKLLVSVINRPHRTLW